MKSSKPSHLKKSLCMLGLSAVLLTTALPAIAVGIPTMDGITAGLLTTNAMAQATEAANALKMAKDGITQVKQQYDHYKGIVTGNDMLGGFLNDPLLNTVMPMGDWADAYDTVKDIASLRARYGLSSKDPSVQQRFDQILAVADALERNYDSTTQRVKNAEMLRAKLNEVQTPQQKEDLQLRYQLELVEQQNQQARMNNWWMLTAQKEKIENSKRAQEFQDFMTGKARQKPTYEDSSIDQ